jgi:hypothetical protein
VLGYRGNPAWRDMSEYVVHFCGTRQALVAILTSGAIEGRTPFGWAREFEQERDAAQRRGERLVPVFAHGISLSEPAGPADVDIEEVQ